MLTKNTKYFITDVDIHKDSIYCWHDVMGEYNIEPHIHEKGQFLYTEGGVVHVVTDEKTYLLPARHYMWIASGCRHALYPDNEKVIMRNLYFPQEAGELDFYNRTAIYPVSDLLLQMIRYCKQWAGDIFSTDVASYRFALALKAILPSQAGSPLPLSLPLVNDKRLKEVIDYMQKHLSEPLTFADIAAKFGFSERSLSRLFFSELGMTYSQYHTLQKMMQALKLLLEDGLTISEVAMEVGYLSVPTFSTTFYKLLGVRPTEYVKFKGVLGTT